MPRRQQDRSYRRSGNSVGRKNAPVIAALDFETDPFAGPGQSIRPFAAGFYDGTTYHGWWGDDCIQCLVGHIHTLTNPHIIYAHNGGRFDFSFMLNAIEPEVFCIGTRIVRAYVRGRGIVGRRKDLHELRDSFAIVPVALARAGAKSTIDYARLSRSRRDKHRQEIQDYLRQDCVALHEVVLKWRGEFGGGMTMAGAAMKKLQAAARTVGIKRAYQQLSERQDGELRPFYFGGRVECFERGIIKGDWKIHDINSSYPNVMRAYMHPVSAGYSRGTAKISERTDFAIIDADSDGALPRRNIQTGKLEFPHGRGVFHATGHEIRMAESLGLLRIHKVIDDWTALEHTTFTTFVDTYYALRREAQLAGNETYSLFWKLAMNGAYGKFAQNPRRFTDKMIVRLDDDPPGDGWVLEERYELMDIYSRPIKEAKQRRGYLNVGTGASITGAARAELMKGLANCERPVYCDTDSIICNKLHGNVIGTELGQWKVEASGNTVAICERKLYALFSDAVPDAFDRKYRVEHWDDPACVKLASKGVRLTAAQILDVARGLTVRYVPLAPTIRLDGRQLWTPRNVRSPTLQARLGAVPTSQAQLGAVPTSQAQLGAD